METTRRMTPEDTILLMRQALRECLPDVLDNLGIKVEDGERMDMSPQAVEQLVNDLGHAVAWWLYRDAGTMSDTQINRIACPLRVDRIVCECPDVTAFCPLTGERDEFEVEIDYRPREWCVETGSLRRYLRSFKDRAMFCEDMATQIARDVCEAVHAEVRVVVTRMPSDGISLRVEAHDGRGLSG